MNDNDLLFKDDVEPLPRAPAASNPWYVLVVDDDPEVHVATRLALSDIDYLGRPLHIRSAHSAAEARRLFHESIDVAVVLLDVMMETDDAGLELVRYIRDELGWNETRIVLRTGQPGVAPEREVILRYDINDYKTKSELTDSQLFTTMIAALRSYRHLRSLEESKSGLRKVIDASASLHQGRSMELFASGVLLQLAAILETNSHSILCTHRHLGKPGSVRPLAGSGRFADIHADAHSGAPDRAFGADVNARLSTALLSESSVFGPDYAAIYLRTPHRREVIVYVESTRPFRQLDLDLLEMFGHNISVGYDNLGLYQEVVEANERLEQRVVERTMELRRFKAAVDQSAASILITDPHGVIEYANPAVSRTSLYAPEELIGCQTDLFKSGMVPKETFVALWNAVLNGENWRGELLNRRRDGDLYWEDVSISPIVDETGTIAHLVAVKEDISRSKQVEEELRQLATLDGLTGLLNRRSFTDLASQEFSRCHRHAGSLAVLMIDIDHFKTVNDTYGHPSGDEVIRAVASGCHDVLRDRDVIGRLGGEEFACILPDTPLDQAAIVAERLRLGVAATPVVLLDGRPCSVTISIGVSTMRLADVKFSAVLARADTALYAAKQAGRNCVRSDDA